MIRIFFLILFVICAVVVTMERDDFLLGLEGYISGEGQNAEVRKKADLASPQKLFSKTVKVMGIPDYKNTCRVTSEEKQVTCFRILDFSNLLAVCTPKGLDTPEGIDDIIQPRALKGRLIWLDRTPFDKDLRKCLKESYHISLGKKALVLLEGQSFLPPIEKIAILGFCLLLGLYSLYRTLKP